MADTSTILAGNFIYQVYPKNTSTIVNINDIAQTSNEYLVYISSSETDINSSLNEDITITLNTFSLEFKNNIINRYSKYKFYYDKYNTYNSLSDASTKELFMQDIEDKVAAYNLKIENAKSTYPGQIDSSALPYYNEKLYNYVSKYQNKLDNIYNNYYTNNIIDETKITTNDISVYKASLKEKYKKLDSLHIMPVIMPPSKALSGRTEHKFDGSTNSWHPKWVDSLLQYYKNINLPKIRASKLLYGKTDKYEYDLSSTSLLTLLYLNIIANTEISFQVSATELYNMYNDIILSINDNAYSGKYYIRNFKKYVINELQNRGKLKYFYFKYMIIDTNTSRMYSCNSDLMKYTFPKSENDFIAVLIIHEFTRKEYWESGSIDRRGLVAIGIYNTSDGLMHSRDISDEVIFSPWHNLQTVTDAEAEYVDVSVGYDNGDNVVYAATPIRIIVGKNIPRYITVDINRENTICGLPFDRNTMIIDASVVYYSSSTRLIKNSSLLRLISTPYIITDGSNDLLSIYRENSSTAYNRQIFIGVRRTLTSISLASSGNLSFYAGLTILSSDLSDVTFLFTYSDGHRQYVNYYDCSTLSNGNKLGFDYEVDNTGTKQTNYTSSYILFKYYNNSTDYSFAVGDYFSRARVTSLSVITPPPTLIYAEEPITIRRTQTYNNVLDIYGTKLEIDYSNDCSTEIILDSSNTVFGTGNPISTLLIKTFTLVSISMDSLTAYVNGNEVNGTRATTLMLTILDSSISIPAYYTTICYTINGLQHQITNNQNIILNYNDITDNEIITLLVYNTNNPSLPTSQRPYVGPTIQLERITLYGKVQVTYRSLVADSSIITANDTYITFSYEGASCILPISIYKVTSLTLNLMDVSTYNEGDSFDYSSAQEQYQVCVLTPYVTLFNNSSIGYENTIALSPISYASTDYTFKNRTISRDDLLVSFTYKGCSISTLINVGYYSLIRLYTTTSIVYNNHWYNNTGQIPCNIDTSLYTFNNKEYDYILIEAVNTIPLHYDGNSRSYEFRNDQYMILSTYNTNILSSISGIYNKLFRAPGNAYETSGPLSIKVKLNDTTIIS